jgi:hypothetical protein
MIGEPEWPGKYIVVAVILAKTPWLLFNCVVCDVILGMNRLNMLAILANSKVDFVEQLSRFKIIKILTIS